MPGPSTQNVVNNSPIVSGTSSQIVSTYSGTTPTLSLASNVVNTTQPLFFAYLSTTKSNVTGNATHYTILYDTAPINQGSGYNTGTGMFTAPVTGRYLFSCCNITVGPVGAADSQLTLATTGGNYTLDYYGQILGGQAWQNNGCMIVPMTSGNTASIQFTMAGSTLTASVTGSGSPYSTFFCGVLMMA